MQFCGASTRTRTLPTLKIELTSTFMSPIRPVQRTTVWGSSIKLPLRCTVSPARTKPGNRQSRRFYREERLFFLSSFSLQVSCHQDIECAVLSVGGIVSRGISVGFSAILAKSTSVRMREMQSNGEIEPCLTAVMPVYNEAGTVVEIAQKVLAQRPVLELVIV